MSELPISTKDPFLEACLPGDTKELLELKESIIRFNTQDDEVRAILLLGESGVGKTYVAKVIAMHRCWLKELFLKTESEPLTPNDISEQKQWYVRNKGSGLLKASGDPYHEVPLPLLEGNMARAWLFGYEKGAFTDAKKASPGFLGMDTVTDVLLDEIGYASLDMQRSLLQVIQSGEYYKLNSTKKETTEVRLIFATNQDLEALVRKGDFQEDLWWRLTDHVLYIPPLRERRSEIEALALAMVASLNQEHIKGDGSAFLHLTKADLDWASRNDWSGNIRELEKTVHRWFFYRATRSLQDVWAQIAPFVPRRNSSLAAGINLDAPKLRTLFRDRIETALSTNLSLGSPETLLREFVAPTKDEAAQILTSCIDDLKMSREQLEQLFPDIAKSSIQPWLSRNRH